MLRRSINRFSYARGEVVILTRGRMAHKGNYMFKFEDLSKYTAEWTKLTTDFFALVPKNEKEIKDALLKLQAIFKDETENSKTMWATYFATLKGEAAPKDITAANKKAQELLKTTGFAFLLILPGTVFFLPVLIKTAKEYGVDLVPESVKKQFDI